MIVLPLPLSHAVGLVVAAGVDKGSKARLSIFASRDRSAIVRRW